MKGHEDGDKTGAPFLYEKAERLLSLGKNVREDFISEYKYLK